MLLAEWKDPVSKLVLISLLRLLQAQKRMAYIKEVGYATGLNHRRYEVVEWMYSTMEDDLFEDKPFLASLIISSSNMPGNPYFANARKLGYEIGETKQAQRAFWLSQMDMLAIPPPDTRIIPSDDEGFDAVGPDHQEPHSGI
jgi:hypothetical protein